jgi:hypothetical protein
MSGWQETEQRGIGILANAVILVYLMVGGKFGWVPAG